tara:strand:- start:960 stop:1772 length:813 start_codon:yes stop_codon:yes gene_type:complete
MLRALAIWPLLAVLALPAHADARIAVLLDLMRLPEFAGILQEENWREAERIEADMLDGQGSTLWEAQLRALLTPERTLDALRQAMAAHLPGDLMDRAVAFYGTGAGQSVTQLELDARRLMADPEVEAAAKERYAELTARGDPVLAEVRRIIKANDMVGRNVAATLNANYQFLRGLDEGGAIDGSQADHLAEAAAQHDRIEEQTRTWLGAYMLLAYHPLPEGDLATYAAFMESPAGRALNAALFAGFGAARAELSYALGRFVAVNRQSGEL